MAIERKDRSFNRIFDEISLGTVPVDYISMIKIEMIDGTVVEISAEDLEGFDSTAFLFQQFRCEDIMDIGIQLDYEKVKTDVTKDVNAVLNTLFDQDD
jgi:hypothetical protein